MASNAPPLWMPQPDDSDGALFHEPFPFEYPPAVPASEPNDWRWLELPTYQPPVDADPDADAVAELTFDPPPYERRRSRPDSTGWSSPARSETELEQIRRPLDTYPNPFTSLPIHADSGEMSCIAWYPKGDACITYTGEHGTMETIPDLNPWIIEERCPLIAQAFETSSAGPQLHLEALTPRTVQPFLRYLYTGTYAVNGASGDQYEDVPSSVLLHCQLYRLGDIYDIPDLKSQAYVNVMRQCEFGCSSPDQPIDLCPAIEFVYQHLQAHANLIETIVSYCVSCFLSHNLGEDEEFKQVAFDLRPFHQALCRESMNREFENETATAIIRLPFRPYAPAEYASREDARAARSTGNDFVYHFHGDDDFDHAVKKRKTSNGSSGAGKGPGIGNISLALRLSRQSQDVVDANSHVKDEPASPIPDDPSSPRGAAAYAAYELIDPPAHINLGVDDKLEKQEASLGGQWRKRSASLIEDNQQDQLNAAADAEYEMVGGPAPVEDVEPESDSDSSIVVITECLPSNPLPQQNTLPIRARKRTGSADSKSDSEWSLV